MVQPTPWRGRRDPQPLAGSTRSSTGGTRRRRIDLAKLRARVPNFRVGVQLLATLLRENWGYLCAAIGSIVTFILLFRPWLATDGPDGTIWSNAFGQTHITTTLVGLWSKSPPASYNLSGKWAILATIAIFLTVLAALINLWARTGALAGLTTISAAAVA